jgi:cytochrome c oxidase subunit IV
MSAHHSPEEIKKNQKTFWTVGGVLFVLTILTVAVAYFHLPLAAAVLVALLVASLKGGLVAGIFMHLIAERKVIYQLLILTIVFFIAILALPLLSEKNSVGRSIQPPTENRYRTVHDEDHGEESAGDHAETAAH